MTRRRGRASCAPAGDPEDTGAALIAQLAQLPKAMRDRLLAGLPVNQQYELNERWAQWAQHAQIPPPTPWRVWMLRAGRGFGKTRAGAEWVAEFARTHAKARIALVGATADDVWRVMVHGSSGLLGVLRDGERADWRVRGGTIRFNSGAQAFIYSAERPDSLRGPEHHIAWCDEIAKWRHGVATWDNLMMGLRMGEHPKAMVTTTPRAVQVMHRVRKAKDFAETTGATHENPYLPASFVAAMQDDYGGTRLGRQELEGELIDDVEGALWPHALIDARRVDEAPALARVVIGVDPPASAAGDACGIVAVGLGKDGFGYVLADASVSGLSPEGWAKAVSVCATRWKADRVVAEKNQGGDMVESVLLGADARLPVTLVHASRGKAARAEPIAVRYEAGKVWHAGRFPELEAELCGLQRGGGYQGPGRSPDRADALVWALHELLLTPQRGEPGVAIL
ncbi:DNA-packaging protein [Sphingomonas sp. MMS12-HWE2-04]|uniref:DNA-packaging protein n=1 Tax=Sphingomonas sp. MMS12-HWE2-04 TaxID=3234199 RepID=UPI0038516529